MMVETWLPIPDYADIYEISDLGRIRRIKADRGRYAGRVLAGGYNPNGYYHVTLSKQHHQRTVRVHPLVAKLFIGEPPTSKHEVNHKDGIKAHNWATNLEWMTPSQNVQHAFALGLRIGFHGEANGMAKLTRSDVTEIRASQERGVALAVRYGVNFRTISRIRLNQIWRAA